MAKPKAPKVTQIETVNPEQRQVINQLLQQALGVARGLQQQPMGQLPSFEPIAQRARTQFQQQTIPSIAERFTALDGQRSSGFPQILGQQAAGLEEALAALAADYGIQQQQLGLQGQGLQQNLLATLLGIGTQPTFQNYLQERQPGFWSRLGNAFTGGVSNSVGQFGSGLANLGTLGLMRGL